MCNIDENIDEYIRNHAIINIGEPPNGYICFETIVDDPFAFIPIIRENNCYIEEITWWDRAEIVHGSSIGYGGPRDPDFPDTFYYAETDIFKRFKSVMADEVYYRYFEQIKKDYYLYELYPAFVIRRDPSHRESSPTTMGLVDAFGNQPSDLPSHCSSC